MTGTDPVDPATHPGSTPPVGSDPARAAPLSWAAVVGFGTLALLWPLLGLLGVVATIGEGRASVILLVVTAVVWVVGAGVGRVPRPVLTLALAGVLFGIVLRLSLIAVGVVPEIGWQLTLLSMVFEVVPYAGLGALAGLAARAIQRRLPVA